MNKKIIKTICYLIMFCILTISLTGCSKDDKNKELKQKINDEISYLDTKIVSMLNKANGISLENYIVKAEQINQTSNNEGQSSTSNKSQKESSESNSDTGGDSQSSGGDSSAGGAGDSPSSKGQNNTKNVKYKMEEMKSYYKIEKLIGIL